MVRALPFQVTCAELSKPVPLTVSVYAEPPVDAVAGASDVTVGMTAVMENCWPAETPPPVDVLDTETKAVEMNAMSEALISTSSLDGDT